VQIVIQPGIIEAFYGVFKEGVKQFGQHVSYETADNDETVLTYQEGEVVLDSE
jgi:hypothetical protein